MENNYFKYIKKIIFIKILYNIYIYVYIYYIYIYLIYFKNYYHLYKNYFIYNIYNIN